MVAVPSFEIDGKPGPAFGCPKGPSTVKVQTTCAEQRRSSSELLVILLDDLKHRLKSASASYNIDFVFVFVFVFVFGTHLLSFLEFLAIFVDDRRDVLELARLDEVLCRRERDGLSREFHRVQPVLDVLDLGRAEHQPLLPVRKRA